ncbi:MAG: ABC transporter ATP-binding protein [Betaproteobacteria bacterium]|nr:ABC transporter ATP-binding protein [Betaproteobacteria bacterium]
MAIVNKNIVDLFRKSPLSVALITTMTAASALSTAVADPLFLKFSLNYLLQKNLWLFGILIAIMLAIALVTRLLNYWIDVIVQKLQNKLLADLTHQSLSAFLTSAPSNAANRDAAYNTSRVYDESKQAAGLVQVYLTAIAAIISFVGASIVCLLLSPYVAVILAVLVPAVYVATRFYSHKMSDLAARLTETESGLRGTMTRVVAAVKDIKIFGLHNYALDQSSKAFVNVLDSNIKFTKRYAKIQLLSSSSLTIAELIVLVTIGTQVAIGRLTIGSMMGFISAYWKVVNSVTSFFSIAPEYSRAITAYNRCNSFANELARDENRGREISAEEVSLSNVSYSYGGSLVFERLNIQVPLRTSLLIRGPNGIGKTTLLNMICGFITASDGSSSLPRLERISASIGPDEFVPGRLRDLLKVINGNDWAVTNSAAARLLLNDCLDKEFRDLSIGERRKAHILTTIAKSADVYIFDEPLAGVDIGSRDAVMDAIFNFCGNRILIVVMHGDIKYDSLFSRVIEFGELASTHRPTAVGVACP